MADVNIDRTALAAAVALGQAIGQPVTTETVHFAVIPQGTEVKSLKDLQYPHGLRPDRIIGSVTMRDAVSFRRYVEAFRDDRTRIFAEPKELAFLAVLDYHGAGERAPEFLSHRVTFKLETEERWNIWASKNEKPFTQTEFAEFIEDNAADISDPSAAHMLEVARDLQATTEANFDSKVKLTNGQVQLKYTETINATVGAGNLEIPETFKISVPVFYGEQKVSITARLRYRLAQGKLSFYYKLYRQNETLQTAFNAAVASIGEALKADILLGKPA